MPRDTKSPWTLNWSRMQVLLGAGPSADEGIAGFWRAWRDHPVRACVRREQFTGFSDSVRRSEQVALQRRGYGVGMAQAPDLLDKLPSDVTCICGAWRSGCNPGAGWTGGEGPRVRVPGQFPERAVPTAPLAVPAKRQSAVFVPGLSPPRPPLSRLAATSRTWQKEIPPGPVLL